MSTIAIITARGGSKRIPRKNIKEFLGKPIIAYSIDAAIQSNLFDEIMVSTDDHEIAEIAETYGAKVPFFRSGKNSDDYATTVDAIMEVLNEYELLGKTYKYGCCIYPTAPLLQTGILSDAFQLLVNKNYNTVFPVVEYSYPIQRSLNIDQNGKVNMNWPEHIDSRSQDLEKSYHDAGQFYWFNTSNLIEDKKLFGKNSGGIVLPVRLVQDIDTEDDWIIAELKAKLLK